jgi:hypothetical protein
MSLSEAGARMEESRHWWRDDVYDAFMGFLQGQAAAA